MSAVADRRLLGDGRMPDRQSTLQHRTFPAYSLSAGSGAVGHIMLGSARSFKSVQAAVILTVLSGVSVWKREEQPLRGVMKRMFWGRLAALAVAAMATSVSAFAQNLDQGKSGAKLFADTCTTCHRSARGLAKGRFRLTLYVFLKDHYSTGSDTAWALASYLASLDDTPHGRPSGKPKKTPSAPHASLKPPMPVPER